jgi:Ca2+-binding EF-hand superfamily protein
MKTTSWFRAFTCGVSVGVGGLLGVPWLWAEDGPAVANGEKPASLANDHGSSAQDEPKPAAKVKRKGKPKKSAETPQVDPAESTSAQVQDSDRKPEAPPSEYALTKELLGNLSPEHMKSLGQMLEQDWKDRPEWGEMAVAILKDDFMRPGAGWWKPSSKRYDWKWLSERCDANKDGKVEREEFPSDVAKADQLFERLDRDGDGQLTPADFDYTESAVPAFMNVAAMKNMMSNQLFSRLDKDSNGRVTMDELAEFFRYGDKEQLEFLTPEDLRFALDPPPSKKPASDPDNSPPSVDPSTPAAALKMFLRGDMGWLTSGPPVGDLAPDFTLPTHDGSAKVTLSDSFGKRPVVLVFGSFT